MSLESLGWNPGREATFTPHRSQGLEPARVARAERDRYLVLTATAERGAEVAGRFRHAARTPAEFPTVGDWVAVRAPEGDGVTTIHALLPRGSAFVRKAAGEVTEEQVIAANIDVVLVVMGLDANYNVRRLERYLAAAWDSGAEPVVVLNKTDLAADLDEYLAEVESAAPGVPVVPMSARTGTGIEVLSAWVQPGRTVALLGSSGVGKSTLVNALAGDERQRTGEVRADDSRGRHTTTWRELVCTPSGAVLIDTPGMRQFQLWGDGADVSSAFSDVESLAADCKFRDCSHEREPGCAVLAAVDSGGLERERYDAWRKLQRELRWLATRNDQRLAAAQQAKWKAISKSAKNHPKYRR